jgi:hypothetical protein
MTMAELGLTATERAIRFVRDMANSDVLFIDAEGYMCPFCAEWAKEQSHILHEPYCLLVRAEEISEAQALSSRSRPQLEASRSIPTVNLSNTGFRRLQPVFGH